MTKDESLLLVYLGGLSVRLKQSGRALPCAHGAPVCHNE